MQSSLTLDPEPSTLEPKPYIHLKGCNRWRPSSTLAGVTWFRSVCAALGVPAGDAFRCYLLALTPGLLKSSSFNHELRGQVNT
jgi:hypothetical protein